MNKIEWKIKPFKELTIEELYQTLKLRSEVFVVEQNCAYLDLDGKDTEALFLIGSYQNEIVAHARLLNAGVSYENASIGRVVISENYRDRKWGHELMQQAISGIAEYFNQNKITISAQLYLQKFYESHGFIAKGEMYLEDDIPHIKMIRNG
ncbi:GNAT family N-acetyltransferase [Flavobacterium agrisoli]|uniref:GNAT family N-acetyltransferase n=1 Tax=Flavobacterium agrisoli TaxID=2793066 RepID=A0A934PLW8_9FLAO|nr:GNAT family N-acetyltransferase [Flavobacterium agrisoli]MBK0369670.1 GNAT family N-acetyltransferase [Flavobacterium agrisoli]